MTNQDKTILIVDDDKDIVNAISTILAMENYATLHAFTGKECLSCLKQQKPDLVLLDYMLPDKTGKEIVEIIRANEQYNDIPIVLISAAHGLEDIGKKMAIDGWIEKPFELEKLLAVVSQHL